MSGPIVRKYGFPNFEAIFGAREIQHGAPSTTTDEPAPPTPGGDESQSPSDPALSPVREPGSPPGVDATEEEKASEDSAQL